jgi:hypothetical protein
MEWSFKGDEFVYFVEVALKGDGTYSSNVVSAKESEKKS